MLRVESVPCDHRTSGSKRVDGMMLNRTASTRCEKVQAFPALAMALFEQSGLTELIDSRFEIDPRIKLTPGNAVKA